MLLCALGGLIITNFTLELNYIPRNMHMVRWTICIFLRMYCNSIGLQWVMFCSGLIPVDFSHIIQNYFTGRWGGCLASFFCSAIFPVFQNYQNTGYILNITFILDRYCQLHMVTLVKFEVDSKNLAGTFTQWKICLKVKLTNWVLVPPPHPPPLDNLTSCLNASEATCMDMG